MSADDAELRMTKEQILEGIRVSANINNARVGYCIS